MENKAMTLQEEDREDALSFRDLPIYSDDQNDVVLPLPQAGFEFSSRAEPAADFARHPRNGLFIRRESFKRRSHSSRAASDADEAVLLARSSSVRFGRFLGDNGKPAGFSAPATPGRHKAVIGVVKMTAKMEMSDMRKRQSRRRAGPVTMFPAGCGGAHEVVPAVAGNGVGGEVVVGKSGNHWGLLKPLRSSAHLVGALTKFGCIPHIRI